MNFLAHETGDITARKHRGNAESAAAYERIKGTLREEQEKAFVAICAADPRLGLTVKEYARQVIKQDHEVSGRFSELKTRGLIEALPGVRREKSAAMVPATAQRRLL